MINNESCLKQHFAKQQRSSFINISVSISMLWADNNTIEEQLNTLKKYSQGRLGVALINTEDNSQITYRGEERFAMAEVALRLWWLPILKARKQ